LKTDAEFVAALEESQQWVAEVARWMERKGYDVQVKPQRVRPSFESRHDFADEGDIEVRQRVEVKAREVDFTGPDDYPYPTVIVDEQYKVDRRPMRLLFGYVILNRSRTHACLIPARTRRHWSVVTLNDRKDRERRSFYVVAVGLCAFVRLV
jgi:hypothetical protein